MSTAAIILAAGKSTRMRSKRPKPLHSLCGLPMTAHVIRACRAAGAERIIVVVGHEADAVKAGLGEDVEYALQTEQRGTGDAVKAAQPLLADWPGDIFVLAGDVPLLTADTLKNLLDEHQSARADATLLTAFLDDPTGYGRVVRDDVTRHVHRIVEERDATRDERALKEWSPSLYVFRAAALWSTLADIQPNNAQGEFYLTDTIGLISLRAGRVEGIPVPDAREVLGVNTRIELAEVAAILRQRILRDLMLSGVTILDPPTTYVEVDVEVGMDTILEPNTLLLKGTRIGEDCILGPFTRIEGSTLGNNVRVLASHVVASVLEDSVRVGPFAHLRPGTHLERGVKIGDFVEIKNARFGEKAQASHLSYIGDADIGAGTNIGAGTITCNYDGFNKFRTTIGKNAFVGSHSTLIAPLTVGDNVVIGAATRLAQDIPDNALALSPTELIVKEDGATRYRARRTQKPGAT